MSAFIVSRLPVNRGIARLAPSFTAKQSFSVLSHYVSTLSQNGSISKSLLNLRLYSSKSFPPHTTIAMPALSPTMTAGNIGVWQKKPGDAIAPGDVLVEIETDKAQMDFEMADEGFLAKVLIDAGTKDVAVGTPIAVMVEDSSEVENFANFTAADAGGDKPSEVQAPSAVANSDVTPPTPSPDVPNAQSAASAHQGSAELTADDRILASPSARRLAHEKNVPLDQIKGTGPNGRIIKEDVLNYNPASATSQSTAANASSLRSVAPPSAVPGARYIDIPVSNMRRTIALRLSESKQTVPHYYLTAEIDMTRSLALRSEFNSAADGKYKLSVNDFIIKASAAAMKDVPEVNSAWHDDIIRQYQNVDISVAVATPNGLITPIVADVGSLGLSSISNKVKELASKAREGKLAPHEYQGGTFTISNLGMFGVQHFTAIINIPQSCILAIGGTENKLVLDASTEKGFKSIPVMKVTLSCDHRTVDGAVGAQWLKAFKGYMEVPNTLLL